MPSRIDADTVKSCIEILENAMSDLKNPSKCVIMDMVGTILDDMTKLQKFRSIEQAVLDRLGRSLSPITINKGGKKVEVYKLRCNGKMLQSSSYEGIIRKLAAAYCIREPDDRSCLICDIFEDALKEKIRTENSNPNTIERLRYDYGKYISKELGNKRIQDVTDIDLKAYTGSLTKQFPMKQKAFLSYKGILNLIFGYAFYHGIIDNNPVEKIKNSVYKKDCDQTKPKPEDKILSPKEIDVVKQELNYRKTMDKYDGYCVNAFVCELAIETGMRVAELCALKEEDIHDDYIHIHAQQLYEKRKGGKNYYYAGWTKDEKGTSQGGRYFPITDTIRNILDENRETKERLGIHSEYVFCHPDGDWVKTDAYETFLRRMMRSLGISITNNHAFRMSLNSNVFIPAGIPVTERARLLGHSPKTNLQYYSYAGKDSLDRLKEVLNSVNTQ